MTYETLLRSVLLALRRKRQIPSEKKMLIEEITRHPNRPYLYRDRQLMAAGDREDD